jgi:hypothetical protein
MQHTAALAVNVVVGAVRLLALSLRRRDIAACCATYCNLTQRTPVLQESPGIMPSLAADSFGIDDAADAAVPATLMSPKMGLMGSSSRSSRTGGMARTVDLLKEAALIASAAVCPRKVTCVPFGLCGAVQLSLY